MRRLALLMVLLFLAALALVAERSDRSSSAETLDPCEDPLAWRVGSVDPRFGISPEELERAVREAAGIWEAAAGRAMFRRDTTGMTINLVYDERQEAYEVWQADEAELEALRSAVETASSRLDGARSRVATAEAEHTRLRTRASLDRLQAEVDRLNRAVDRYNTAVVRYNEAASAAAAGGGQLVKAGDLSWETRSLNGRVVSIRRTLSIGLVAGYEELVLVLAHELGHAIGLDHLPHPDAVMTEAYRHGRTPYPVQLHPADREALAGRCGDR